MCGIAGLYRLGKRPIRKWQIQVMACSLQYRGMDATGFALQQADGRIAHFKNRYPAWKVTADPDWHKWVDECLKPTTIIALVHTRQYTKGSPYNNENNHPLTVGEGLIIHNGMARNDDVLFRVNKELGFKRSCETDSDIFRAILDNHGCIDKELIKEMGLVEGTAAVAAIHKNSPGKLLLLRDSNPLVLGATSDMLGFASDKDTLHKVLKPWIKIANLPLQVHAPDLSFTAMKNETGYIFGPKGLEEHDVFKCNGHGTGGYVKYVKKTDYHFRQESQRAAANHEPRHFETINPTTKFRPKPAVINLIDETPAANSNILDNPKLFQWVVCPNKACNKHVELSADDRKLDSIAVLACNSCGTNLATAPDASFVN